MLEELQNPRNPLTGAIRGERGGNSSCRAERKDLPACYFQVDTSVISPHKHVHKHIKGSVRRVKKRPRKIVPRFSLPDIFIYPYQLNTKEFLGLTLETPGVTLENLSYIRYSGQTANILLTVLVGKSKIFLVVIYEKNIFQKIVISVLWIFL